MQNKTIPYLYFKRNKQPKPVRPAACLTLNEKTKFSSAGNNQGTGVNHGQNLFPGVQLLKIQQGTEEFHQMKIVCLLYSHTTWGPKGCHCKRNTKAFFLTEQ